MLSKVTFDKEMSCFYKNMTNYANVSLCNLWFNWHNIQMKGQQGMWTIILYNFMVTVWLNYFFIPSLKQNNTEISPGFIKG